MRGVSSSVSQTESWRSLALTGAGTQLASHYRGDTQALGVLAGAYRLSAGTVVLVARTLPRWMLPSAAALGIARSHQIRALHRDDGSRMSSLPRPRAMGKRAIGPFASASVRPPPISSSRRTFGPVAEGASQLGYGGLVSVGHQHSLVSAQMPPSDSSYPASNPRPRFFSGASSSVLSPHRFPHGPAAGRRRTAIGTWVEPSWLISSST